MTASHLNNEEFANLIKNAPLVSIDLIVRNMKGEILLGLRKNRPARNYWFVPGGRILKNEPLQQAFQRIANAELSLNLKPNDAVFLGVFEHFFDDNKLEIEGVGTHYVALSYKIQFSQPLDLSENEQHHSFKWFSINELLNDGKVHENIKEIIRTNHFFVPDDQGK